MSRAAWSACALLLLAATAAGEGRPAGPLVVDLGTHRIHDVGGSVWHVGEARAEAPVTALRAILRDFERYPDWFPRLAEARVLRAGAEPIVYGRLDLPWPLADRDYVVAYRELRDREGGFWLEAVPTELAATPEQPGVERIPVETRWRVVPTSDGGARITYHARESGPRLSGWLADRTFRSDWATLVRALRDRLVESTRT